MTAQPPQGPTIYSVAEAAGVSIASVSRVFQGSAVVSAKTRAKVLEAAARLNYVPLGAARSLAVHHHEAYGLLLPVLRGPYYSELLVGFESRAAGLGQSVVLTLVDAYRDLEMTVRYLASRVDGIAVFGAPRFLDTVAAAIGEAKPVVMISGGTRPGVDTIRAENLASARSLTGHVMDHGRQRLVFVGDATEASLDIHDRYEGFRLAHADRGRPAAAPVPILFEESDGVGFAEELLARGVDADALVCANDELALSIMDRLMAGGVRIPEDLAIVGWDDVMTARYVRPGLTTVRQPVREIGELAASLLHDRVDGVSSSVEPVVLPTEVVIRGSCGCPEAPRHPTTKTSSQTKTNGPHDTAT